MKKLALFLLPILCLPLTAHGNIAHLQSPAAGTTCTATTCALLFGSNVTAGSFIIMSCSNGFAGATTTGSDTRSNTYALDKTGTDSADSNATINILSAQNANAGADTVTCTSTSSTTLRINISEYSGVATSGAADQSNNGSGNATAATAGSVTPTQANELVYSDLRNSSNVTCTAGTGFTLRGTTAGAGSMRLCTEEVIQTFPVAASCNMTQSSAVSYAMACVSYKAAATRWTLVQQVAQAHVALNGTIAISSVTAGNLLVVEVNSIGNNTPDSTVSDSAGQTWLSAGNGPTASAPTGEETMLLYLYNANAGTHTLTIGGAQAQVAIQEYSVGSAITSDPLGAISNGNGTSAAPSVSLTTQASNSLIIGIFDTTNTPTKGTGYTAVTGSPTAFQHGELDEYSLDGGAAGAITVTASQTSATWEGNAAEFKLPSAAPAVTVFPRYIFQGGQFTFTGARFIFN